MVLDNLFWLQLVLEIVGLVVRFVLSVGVSLDSDGGSLRLTSSGGVVTMFGVESLVTNGGDGNIYMQCRREWRTIGIGFCLRTYYSGICVINCRQKRI